MIQYDDFHEMISIFIAMSRFEGPANTYLVITKCIKMHMSINSLLIIHKHSELVKERAQPWRHPTGHAPLPRVAEEAPLRTPGGPCTSVWETLSQPRPVRLLPGCDLSLGRRGRSGLGASALLPC